MLSELFDVLDKMRGGVAPKLAARTRTARAALVEEDDSPGLGIEETALRRRRAGAGSPVQKHHRHAVRAARLFPVDFVDRIDTEHASQMGLYRWKKAFSDQPAHSAVCVGTSAPVSGMLSQTRAPMP